MTERFGTKAATCIGDTERVSWGATLTAGETTLGVRLEGGYVTEFKIAGNDILYCGNPQKVKTDATHPMGPVGPVHDDVQHGPSRLGEFTIYEQTSDSLTLHMYDHQRELEFERCFQLRDGSVAIETSVTNKGEEPWLGSVGEHIYLAIDKSQIPNVQYLGPNKLTFRDQEGNLYQNYANIVARVLAGEFFVAQGFQGEQKIQLAEGKVVTVKATASLNGETLPLPDEVLVWHRPGTDSLCPAETMTGLGRSMEVLTGSTLSLRTEIIVDM